MQSWEVERIINALEGINKALESICEKGLVIDLDKMEETELRRICDEKNRMN